MVYLKKVETEYVVEIEKNKKKLKRLKIYRFSIIEFYIKCCVYLIKLVGKILRYESLITFIVGLLLAICVFVLGIFYPMAFLMVVTIEHGLIIVASLSILYIIKRLYVESNIKTQISNKDNLIKLYMELRHFDKTIDRIKEELTCFENLCSELEIEENIKYKKIYESELLALINYLNDNRYHLTLEQIEKIAADLSQLEKLLLKENHVIKMKINEENITLITKASIEVDKMWKKTNEPITDYISIESNALAQLTLLQTLHNEIFSFLKANFLLEMYNEIKFNQVDKLEKIYTYNVRVGEGVIGEFVDAYDHYYYSINELLKIKVACEKSFAQMDQFQKMQRAQLISVGKQNEEILLNSEKNHKENMKFNRKAYKEMLDAQDAILNSVNFSFNSLGTFLEDIESNFNNLFEQQATELQKVRENIDYDIQYNRNGLLRNYN